MSVIPKNEHEEGRSVNDDGKSAESLHNEYLRAVADLEGRYPEAAKKMNTSGLDIKNPNAVILARDQAQNLMREEEGKQLQQAMMGGAVGLTGLATAISAINLGGGEKDKAAVASKGEPSPVDSSDSALGGAGKLLGITSAKNGEIGTNILDGNDPLREHLRELRGGDQMLNLAFTTNPRLTQLAKDAGVNLASSNPQEVNPANLGNFSLQENLPNKVAEVQIAQNAGASRGTRG
ncbi:MAG: hypothetical protein ABL857_02255 [Rickettsiales bacterium]